MFMAYQPHMYELQRRLEKQREKERESSHQAALANPSTLPPLSMPTSSPLPVAVRVSTSSNSAHSSSSNQNNAQFRRKSDDSQHIVNVFTDENASSSSSSGAGNNPINSTSNASNSILGKWIPLVRRSSSHHTAARRRKGSQQVQQQNQSPIHPSGTGSSGDKSDLLSPADVSLPTWPNVSPATSNATSALSEEQNTSPASSPVLMPSSPSSGFSNYVRTRRLSRDGVRFFKQSIRHGTSQSYNSNLLSSSDSTPIIPSKAPTAAAAPPRPIPATAVTAPDPLNSGRMRTSRNNSARPLTAEGQMRSSKAFSSSGSALSPPHLVASRSEQDLTSTKSFLIDNLQQRKKEKDLPDPPEEQQEVLMNDLPLPMPLPSPGRHYSQGLRIVTGDEIDNNSINNADDRMLRFFTTDISLYPLPVRLGLISPEAYDECASAASPSGHRKTFASTAGFTLTRPSLPPHVGSVRYVDGYFLCTPPPKRRVRKLSQPVSPVTSPLSSPILNGTSSRHSFLTSSSSSSSTTTTTTGLQSPQLSSRRRSIRPGPPLRPHSSGGVGGNGRPTKPTSFLSIDVTSKAMADEEKWTLDEYFSVQRVRRPGHFGFKERKIHAYPPEIAPYPWGYGPDSIMADDLMHAAVDKSIGSTSSMCSADKDGTSTIKPLRVLDVGCGVGSWVIDMAREWPEAEFIGLDLVPIQRKLMSSQTPPPPPSKDDQSGSSNDGNCDEVSNLHKRISWVVANALDGLPFAEQTFDLVHIRFINEGIPQRKWPMLLAEAMRVLRPNGQLEVMELDFSFFGSPMQMDTTELMDLILGRHVGAAVTNGLSYRSARLTNKQEMIAARRNANLLTILRQALARRDINLTPTSILPGHIVSLHDAATDKRHSDIRQIPILARSHRKTFAFVRPLSRESDDDDGGLARETTKDEKRGNIASSFLSFDANDEQDDANVDALIGLNYVEGAKAFATNVQAADARVRVQDLDVLRMAIMQADMLRITDNRHIFWHEIERLHQSWQVKRSVPPDNAFSHLGTAASSTSIEQNTSSFTLNQETLPLFVDRGGPKDDVSRMALDACLKRWPDLASFERDVDLWESEMQERADIDALLRHKMCGGENALRLDGWQLSERVRKRRQHMPARDVVQSEMQSGDRATEFNGAGQASTERPNAATLTEEDQDHPNSAADLSSLSPTHAKTKENQPYGRTAKAKPQWQLSDRGTLAFALQQTTDILGFRTASHYVVHKEDVDKKTN